MLSLVFPIIALGSTHQKLIEKKLSFNRTFLPELLRSLTKGGATIAFAFLGFGVWSLILGQLLGEVVSTVAYWISSAWMPSTIVDRESARSLLSYGIRYVGADAVAVLLLNLDYLLVGRYLGAVALGVYTLAFRLPDLVVLQFARTLSGVVFPVYSRMREISGDMARGFLLTTRYISLITVPLGAGLALVAKPFTEIVFSDKWVDAVPAIQGLAIYSMLLSLAYNAGGAYKASGRPQIITWLGLIRVAILFPALWWAVSGPGTIVAVSWMHALVAFISALLSLHVAARVLNIGVKAVYAAIYPAAAAGCVMAAAVYGVLTLASAAMPVIQLSLGFLVGAIVYLLVLWFFQRDVVVEAGQKLRVVFGRR
jgi:PST family polysaccharide transporter